MTKKEWEKKVKELKNDRQSAGEVISDEEAEKIIKQVYGKKPRE